MLVYPRRTVSRGFGSDVGSGSTDRIEIPYTGTHTQQTISVWFYRTSNGGSGLGRIAEKQTSGSAEWLAFSNGSAIGYTLQGSPQLAATTGTVANAVWTHAVFLHDTTGNQRTATVWLNGAQAATNSDSGVAHVTNTENIIVGNNGAANRVWGGLLADFALYDRILTPAEIQNLFGGARPEYIPNLRAYAPLDLDESEMVGGGRLIVSGTKPTGELPNTLLIHPAPLSFATALPPDPTVGSTNVAWAAFDLGSETRTATVTAGSVAVVSTTVAKDTGNIGSFSAVAILGATVSTDRATSVILPASAGITVQTTKLTEAAGIEIAWAALDLGTAADNPETAVTLGAVATVGGSGRKEVSVTPELSSGATVSALTSTSSAFTSAPILSVGASVQVSTTRHADVHAVVETATAVDAAVAKQAGASALLSAIVTASAQTSSVNAVTVIVNLSAAAALDASVARTVSVAPSLGAVVRLDALILGNDPFILAPAPRCVIPSYGTATLVWQRPLDPHESVFYSIDWSVELTATEDELTLGGVIWTLPDVAVNDGLRLAPKSPSQSSTAATIWLSVPGSAADSAIWAGAGRSYRILNTVNTVGGQRFQRAVTLTVRSL